MLCKFIFLSKSLPGEYTTSCRIKQNFEKGWIQIDVESCEQRGGEQKVLVWIKLVAYQAMRRGVRHHLM